MIIALGDTQPSFTFEMGVIPPLYFVAAKCRDPTIRRRALSLLKKAPRRESSWSALPTRVVEKTIALEEEHSGRFIESPPTRPIVWVDESKRIRPLEVVQEVKPDGTSQFMVKTTRYFENLHAER
jgi:hypothetical protein